MSILSKIGPSRFELSADNYFAADGNDASYTLEQFAADQEIHPTDDICVIINVSSDTEPAYCDICDDSIIAPYNFVTEEFVRLQGCLSHLPAAADIIAAL